MTRPDAPLFSHLLGLKVREDMLVPDGTQVWMQGNEVLDITTDERAKFFAKFGLMRVPNQKADTVMLSPTDYAALVLHAKDASAIRNGGK